jgi:hypothetical protein
MRHKITVFIVLGSLCFSLYNCTGSADNTALGTDSSISTTNAYAGFPSQVEWGRHLVTICGCNDCHTPKRMTDKGPVEDSSLELSGHPAQAPAAALIPDQLAKGMAATYDLTAWNGPWGTSYAANLTPDSTGLGSWSEQQFIICIRQGLFKGILGSRPIMPPMPIAGLSKMTDDELKAIFAFLKTLKPVQNVVPDYQPPVIAKK